MTSPTHNDRPTLAQVVEQMATRMTAAGVVFGHGTHNARDEAIWLTMWKLGLPLDGYDELASGPVSAEQIADVTSVVEERIATRKPAAYLTKEAWLQGVPFFVDERCIVPRSYIAELLGNPDYGHALDSWLSDRTEQVLDLCTGNGSLAILAAMAYPDVVVDAIGAMTPLVVTFVAYTFFALEALSDEIEDPFGKAPNDLALDAMVVSIE